MDTSKDQTKQQAIDVAVTEADKGFFISTEAMAAWVDSWGSEHELPPPEADLHISAV